MNMDKMEQAVWDIAVDMYNRAGNSGGWTMNIHALIDPDHGYSVGGNPKVPEWIIPGWRGIPGPAVVQQIARHIRNIDRADQELSGGWVDDDGVLYLDSPTILESRSQAVALGRERGERAIYCLHTGETITL